MKNILTKLNKVQTELQCAKNAYNSFAKFNYRSCEDILEALKEHIKENKLVLTLDDEAITNNGQSYIKATATLYDMESGEHIATSALARETMNKKGMDDSQCTGTASSYARKYALNGLFAIDDNKDADTDEMTQSRPTQQPRQQSSYNDNPSEQTRQQGSASASRRRRVDSNDNQEQPEQPVRKGISEPQAKRLYALGRNAGLEYPEINDEVMERYGCKVQELNRTNYDEICNEYEANKQ